MTEGLLQLLNFTILATILATIRLNYFTPFQYPLSKSADFLSLAISLELNGTFQTFSTPWRLTQQVQI